MFKSQSDYYVPLLRLLAEKYPDGAELRTVCRGFLQRYREQIPPNHTNRSDNKGREPWQLDVEWSRNTLCRAGLMDDSVRGYWRLTQAGKDWLAQNPTVFQLDARILGSRRSSVSKPRSAARAPAPDVSVRRDAVALPGIDLVKLERIRKELPPDVFRTELGALYEKLLAESRANSITVVTDSGLLTTARQQVRRIQDYLQGRASDTPKSEELCDWIQFAYTFELHREAAALWQYVRQDEVSKWQYDRAKKLAMVCRTRAGA
jgi:hypothetical protein